MHKGFIVVCREGSVIVYADLIVASYDTLSDLARVLQDVSAAANSSQLSGAAKSAASVVVERDGTNHTGTHCIYVTISTVVCNNNFAVVFNVTHIP